MFFSRVFLSLKIANAPGQGCLSFLSPGTVCLTTLFSFLLFILCLSCIKIYLCSHSLRIGTHGWEKERGRLQCNGTFKQLGQFRNRMGCHVISLILEILRQGRCSVPGFRVGCGDRTPAPGEGTGAVAQGLFHSLVLWSPLSSQHLRVMVMLHFSLGCFGLQSNACPSPLWHPVSTSLKVSPHTLSFHSPFRSLAQKLPIHFDSPKPPFIHLALGGRSISVKLD